MILEELLQFPESSWIDWKQDFPLQLLQQKDMYQQGIGTVLKDLVAIANSCDEQEVGYLIYGIKDLGSHRLVKGIAKSFDDARFQQMARNIIEPLPKFSYHEELLNSFKVGIFTIYRIPDYPHVVKQTIKDVLHVGQVYLRQGSENRVATYNDLRELFRGLEPFKFGSMGDPVYKRIVGDAISNGLQLSALDLSNSESFLVQGYTPFYYPGTRRRVWVGSRGNTYELMLFVKPPVNT